MRASRKTASFCLCSALCAAIAASFAAQETKPVAKPKEIATIDGDSWKWSGAADKRICTITGNVVIKHSDTVVTAEKAVYDEKTKTAVVEGGVKIVDDRNEITGPKATAFLKDRKVLIEGGVRMVGNPKPGTPKDDGKPPTEKLREPTVITCDTLEYLYKKKFVTASGNLKITQKDRVIVGQKVEYDATSELITLTGGVKVTDSKGQTFTSPGTVKASLKDGDEWIEGGKGSASLQVNLDEEEEEPEKTPEKTE